VDTDDNNYKCFFLLLSQNQRAYLLQVWFGVMWLWAYHSIYISRIKWKTCVSWNFGTVSKPFSSAIVANSQWAKHSVFQNFCIFNKWEINFQKDFDLRNLSFLNFGDLILRSLHQGLQILHIVFIGLVRNYWFHEFLNY